MGASPTFCGKASKSWYYDDDATSGTSGKSGKSDSGSGSGSGTSGKSWKSEDCSDGPRPSKSGKSDSGSGTSGKSGKSDSSDDRRRLRSSHIPVNKVPLADWNLNRPDDMNVQRRKIHGGD